jgi:ankyrin repeat protein
MLLTIIFIGDVHWFLDICRGMQDLPDLLRVRDAMNRSPSHFAASCGKFAGLYQGVDEFPCRDALIAKAIERDARGLQAIHYASSAGSIADVVCLLEFGAGWHTVTHNNNQYSALDLALTSGQFALAKGLLNANVKWVGVSPAASRCISVIVPPES